MDAVIAVDNRIKKHVEDTIISLNEAKLKCKRVVSIANFTNTDKFSIPIPVERQKYREEYKISENQFVVCCARRLVEKNGVINLVKAMSMIKDKEIVALIAGDGPQKPIIESYIKNNGLEESVRLLGALQGGEIKKLYMASDISVVPSITVNGLQEATSISAIEAMSCGLPTIASNIGGLKQLIENQTTGVLVDEGNVEQIASEIIHLKRDTVYYSHLKDRSRRYIEKNHSHKKTALKYLDEFMKSKIR